MKRAENVFVDTSGFKALVDPKDGFHLRAKRSWKDLSTKGVNLVTSNYVLDESYTLIRQRCGLGIVRSFRQLIAESGKEIKVMRVTFDDELLAWQWFEKDWSKLSFTDCVSFAMMERLAIKHFFGFDDHFARAGFKADL